MENNIENFNTFTETIIKQIVSKDDEETRKMIIKYAKEKYPKENVRIDFYDEEIVRQIIALGIAEYIKKQDDLYKARILGEFNTITNNIEEDIKILEDMCKNGTESYRNIEGKLEIVKPAYVKALENILTLVKGKIIHLSDKEYRQVIENVQKEINNRYMFEKTAKEEVEELLENSISKNKVKEKINRIETNISYVKTEISKTLRENEEAGTETEIDINEQYIERLEIELKELEITKRILEELLEDK